MAQVAPLATPGLCSYALPSARAADTAVTKARRPWGPRWNEGATDGGDGEAGDG